MTSTLSFAGMLLVSVGALVLVFLVAPRPKLNPAMRSPNVPDMSLAALDSWLLEKETCEAHVIDSTKAHIQWAKPEHPEITPLCFLYLHGFSASWQETAPLTTRLADGFSANVVQARIAGHGMASGGMLCEAEEWLQSVSDYFEIAKRIGKQVVIVATSTGAPLSVWLAKQADNEKFIAACLFMSPNFKIRNRFGFLLTWPWSKHWIQMLIGKRHQWQPTSKQEAETWSHDYSTLALIEMQKTLDWANKQDFEGIKIPLALMYMPNDVTISPAAAIKVFKRWGSHDKVLYKVAVDGEAAEHVFVGDITAPHRLDWSVTSFDQFLKSVLPHHSKNNKKLT